MSQAVPWPDTATHRRWLEAETRRLLGFAVGARHPDGGFGWLDDRGDLDLSHPAELWITCRMTHVAALGVLLDEQGQRELLDHGMRALTGPFLDEVGGGWHAELPADAAEPKGAYEHAFVVLAASSATTAGHEAGAALLSRALDALVDRFWEEGPGMVADSWDPATGRLDPYRGVNANMHTVEAFLAAADATGEHLWLDRALRIVERVLDGYAKQHGFRIPEHFDDAWNPLLDYNQLIPADKFRPYGVTIGHGLEWARLALHLRAAIGPDAAPDWLLEHARSLFTGSVGDGWAVDGADGFVYTVDWQGTPVVRERMHWVAAEATATAAALWSTTGQQVYADWYQAWWEYIADAFIDEEHGSWHHELDSANRPSAKVWPGKPDLYHAVQATLVPRLPLTPCIAAGLAAGRLDE